MNIQLKETLTRGSEAYPFVLYEMPNENQFLAASFHWQDDMEILHVRAGKIELTLDSVSHVLTPGDIICINPLQLHGFKGVTPDARCDIFIFPPDHLLLRQDDYIQNNYLRALASGKYGFPTHLNSIPEICPLFHRIFSLQKERPIAYEMMTKALLLQIIATLIQKNALLELQATKHDETCKEILMHIHRHYMNKLNVSEIAFAVGISSNYFSTFFAEHFHMHFAEYLRAYRIEQACLMLTNSNLSVTEIALATGFSSGSHFIHHFHLLKGVTPLTYRKKAE